MNVGGTEQIPSAQDYDRGYRRAGVMAKNDNQKLKLLYLAKIFMEDTDEEHGITMSQLIKKLDDYGVSAERKALYLDITALENFGMDICTDKIGKVHSYRLVSRQFELAELKLLVDSVQSSKFISEKKSNALIKKLESLTSHFEADQLQRQVLISGRVKSMNESTYYNVDDIHKAISQDRQIRFLYVNWTVDKEQVPRRDGKLYQVSPWHLRWDDEYYYLIGYNSETCDIRHYRVDKMKSISITDLPRDGREELKSFNPADYSKKLFGMYSGEIFHVTIRSVNSLVGVLIDRFGKDIPIIKADDDHFDAIVEAAISPQFLGWIASLGPGIRITGPEQVERAMKEFVKELWNNYCGDGS